MPAIAKDGTTKLLIKEIEKINNEEQKLLLRQLKIKAWLRREPKPVVVYKKGAKALNMAQIDAIKHKARTEYAGK